MAPAWMPMTLPQGHVTLHVPLVEPHELSVLRTERGRFGSYTPRDGLACWTDRKDAEPLFVVARRAAGLPLTGASTCWRIGGNL